MALKNKDKPECITLLRINSSLTYNWSLSAAEVGSARIVTDAALAFSILVIQIPAAAKFLSLTPLHVHDWLKLFSNSGLARI